MENLDGNTLAWIIGAIGTLLTLVFGSKFTNIKSKLGKTLREGAEVLVAAGTTLDDIDAVLEAENPSKEQLELVKADLVKVKKEFQDLVDVWKKDPKIPVQ